MRLFVREAYDLVLDARAIPRAFRAHPPAVRRRLAQVVADQRVRRGGGARQVACHLRALHVARLVEREPTHVRVAFLFLQASVLDRPRVDPSRRARLQPVRLEPELDQVFGQTDARRFAGAPGGEGLATDPDLPGHERSGGEHHRGRAKRHPEERAHAPHVVVLPEDQVGDHAFSQREERLALEARAHLARVLPLVRLRAERPHRGAAARVQHALLQVALVRHAADLASQRVHLVHELRLRGAAHRGVARLPRDAVERQRQQQRARASARRRERSLAPSVPRAHHDYVELVTIFVQVIRGDACAGRGLVRPVGTAPGFRNRVVRRRRAYPRGSGEGHGTAEERGGDAGASREARRRVWRACTRSARRRAGRSARHPPGMRRPPRVRRGHAPGKVRARHRHGRFLGMSREGLRIVQPSPLASRQSGRRGAR